MNGINQLTKLSVIHMFPSYSVKDEVAIITFIMALYNPFTNKPESTCEPMGVRPHWKLPGDDSCLCTPHAWEENCCLSGSDPPYPCRQEDWCLSRSDPQAASFLNTSAWVTAKQSSVIAKLIVSNPILNHCLVTWSYTCKCLSSHYNMTSSLLFPVCPAMAWFSTKEI